MEEVLIGQLNEPEHSKINRDKDYYFMDSRNKGIKLFNMATLGMGVYMMVVSFFVSKEDALEG